MQDIAQDLIRKASMGDSGAFKEIYKGFCGFVYSTALRITANKADAEDITQEVFIKIYDNLKRFEFRSSFKTWIYRITVNTAINFIKRVRKNIEKSFNSEIMETMVQKPQGSLNELEAKDAHNLLIKYMLKALNPEQRACLLLREIEGLSYKEISRVLRLNIGTVRSRLKRAREALINLRNEEVIKNEL